MYFIISIMKFFVGVLIITVCALKVCNTHPVSTNTTTKIQLGDYPYQCVIRIKVDNGEDFLVCEGAIIAKNWVLTASGCVDKYESNHEILQVVAGIVSTEDIESQSQAQVRRVLGVEISPPPTNSKKEFEGIALLKVSSFKFNKYVNRAEIGGNTTIKQNARLIGYGESEILTSVDLKVFSKQESRFSCTKKNSDNDGDVVFYDESFAGAPLLPVSNSTSTYTIFGIKSAKDGSMFTNVAAYEFWIKRTANISQPNGTTESTTQSATTSNHTKSSDNATGSDGSSGGKNETSTSRTSTSSLDDSEDDSESLGDGEESTTTANSSSEESEKSSEESDEESTTTEDAAVETSEEEESSSEEKDDEKESSGEEISEESSDEEIDEDDSDTTTTTDSSESDSSDSENSEEKTPTTNSTPASTTTSSLGTTQRVTETTYTTRSSSSTSSSTSKTSDSSTTTSTSSQTTSTSETTDDDDDDDDYNYDDETNTTNTTSELPNTTETSTSTTTAEDDYDYDSKSNAHDTDHLPNKNDTRFEPDSAAEGNSVTSNSAQPLSQSLISNLVSKVNSLFSSIKSLKNFFVAF